MLFRIVIILFLFASTVIADWKADLTGLCQTMSEPEQKMLIGNIVRANPGFGEIKKALKNLPFRKVVGPQYILDSNLCLDGVVRPYVIYVPTGYDPTEETSLLVTLHGGVGRAEIYDSTLQYAREHPFSVMAEEENMILLFPYGQNGATWWDEVGMANTRGLLKRVKSEFNIDDDHVFMGGFSDGGSGSFGHAMLDPNSYGAFLALNGHMGVPSLDGHLPTYAPNLFNSPVFVTTTDRDRLYPTSKMAPTIEMGLRAGGDLLYRQFKGEHNFDDIQSEVPQMISFLQRHPRDPLPSEIAWECGDVTFGQCHWLAINEITIDKPTDWHVDFNDPLIDSTITFGFQDDDSYDSIGIKIGRVIDDDQYIAKKIGLLKDDIIIRGGDIFIENYDSLMSFKNTLNRGDDFNLTVLRGEKNEEVVLTGTLPMPRKYMLFERTVPSAKIKATAAGNRINIETSRVGSFTIYVHPDMFNLDYNIIVDVNGKELYNGRVLADYEYMFEYFLKTRDRELLYVSEIRIDL